MITTVYGKPLEVWVDSLEKQQSSTLQELTRMPGQCAMLILAEYLKSNMPVLARNLRDVHECLLHEIASEHIKYHHAVDPTQPVISTGKTVLPVRIDDIICLRSLTERGTPMLNKCGHWWKVVQANVPTSTATNGGKARWYLRSLTRKEQGLTPIAGFKFDNLWLDKQDDPNYEVTRVCPFPKEFKYKEYE